MELRIAELDPVATMQRRAGPFDDRLYVICQTGARGRQGCEMFRKVGGRIYWDLLDVRTPEEFKRGILPGAINVPVDELRFRLSEFTSMKEIVTFCQIGQRGYLSSKVVLSSSTVNSRPVERLSNRLAISSAV